MVKKLIYVFGWSIALFFATFPNLIMGKMNLEFSAMEFPEIRDTYMLPILMAMVLFLGDVVYVFEQEKCEGKEQKHITSVILLMGLYLFSFLLSLYGNIYCGYIGLFLAWIALTIMKFIKTNSCHQQAKMPEARIIIEEN